MIFTREDITRVMREAKRRMDDDIHDGFIPQNARYIRAELASRMQGVYGTIMAVVPNNNWRDVVWWLDEELEELYEWYGLGNLFNDDGTRNL